MQAYEIEHDAVIDGGESSDYEYQEIMGSNDPIPDVVDLSDTEVANQAAERLTYYACVFFSTANGINIGNQVEGSGIKVDHKEFSQKAIDLGYLNPRRGAMLKS
jgi:hypothetical protein